MTGAPDNLRVQVQLVKTEEGCVLSDFLLVLIRAVILPAELSAATIVLQNITSLKYV